MLSIPSCSSRLLRLSLELDRSARLFELLLDRLGLGLRYALLDRLGRPVDQVLGLFEAEPGDLAHHLDDLDLLVARPGEDDREVLLLGCGRCRRACRSSPRVAPRGRRARSACAGAGPPAPGGAPGAAPAAPRARAASRAPSPRRPAASAHRAARL